MKYMQNGGFQSHSMMKMTLLLTLLFLFGFWITNFALYFSKMGVTPQSVKDYYLGSEANYTMPRTYQSMLEVTHAHLPMMALVVLLTTHLLIFAPYANKTKIALIVSGFSCALLNESAGWLVRFVNPEFAWLKVAAFVSLQTVLGFLILALSVFLSKGRALTLKRPDLKNYQHQKTEIDS